MPGDSTAPGGGTNEDPVVFGALADVAIQRDQGRPGENETQPFAADDDSAAVEGYFGDEADIRSEPWWRVRTLRRRALRGALSVGGMLVFGFVAGNTYTWWSDAFHIAQGRTATARATVQDVNGVVLPWLLPDSVNVMFHTLDGRLVRTAVAHSGAQPHRGSALMIRYALRSPSHAVAIGNPGLPWGVTASGVLAALCLSRIVWRAASATHDTKALVRAARSPEAQPVRYVLLPEDEEPGGWLLFFPILGGAGDRPSHLLRVRAAAFDPVGMADLRGDVSDGGTVVPWVDGRAAWPDLPIAVFGPEQERMVLRLVSGDTADPGAQQAT